MNKMNKYDIDEQFLTEAWAKMRRQLDKQLPVHKPRYFNRMWYVAGLAASLLLFTGYYCYNYENFESTNQYNSKSATNISSSNSNKESNKADLASVIGNEVVSSDIDDKKEENLVLHDSSNDDRNNSFKGNESNLLIEAKNSSINKTTKNKINKTKNDIPSNKIYKNNTKTNVGVSKAIVAKPNVITTASVNSKALEVTPTPVVVLNQNISTENSDLNSINNSSNSIISQNDEIIATTNEAIDFLPLKTIQLNNNINYEIATLLTDTPNSKIWQPKKPISFGLTIGLNSNIKDASGIRAGLFSNYRFTDKLMLGANITYAYDAINTDYGVKYDILVPTEDDPQNLPQNPDIKRDTLKSVNDKINHNANYQGINAKLMFTYFPIKRLGIAGGLFGTRYILNNSTFDFLQENVAYSDRNLESNYSYNKYKAGPAFELQYWVKPKLNIAATFEMNLIPEVKQEFWATANKQDYLHNNFGVALQYQFN